MENKLELRVGDVVRLKPMTVKEFFDDGDILFAEGNWSRSELIESIISHAETDAEKIARLEARVAELEAYGRLMREKADIESRCYIESMTGIKLGGSK